MAASGVEEVAEARTLDAADEAAVAAEVAREVPAPDAPADDADEAREEADERADEMADEADEVAARELEATEDGCMDEAIEEAAALEAGAADEAAPEPCWAWSTQIWLVMDCVTEIVVSKSGGVEVSRRQHTQGIIRRASSDDTWGSGLCDGSVGGTALAGVVGETAS